GPGQKSMTELDATRENAVRLLKDFPGGADRWLYPDAKIAHITVSAADEPSVPDRFSIALESTVSYAQVRDYYRHAFKELVPERRQQVETDEAVVFSFGE